MKINPRWTVCLYIIILLYLYNKNAQQQAYKKGVSDGLDSQKYIDNTYRK
jgi:hypothetical protein